MKPLHQYPQPSRPAEPTPLEMAIYNFELKAKAHYDNKSANKEKLNRDFEHLQKEKTRLLSVVIAQESLSQYRQRNETVGEEVLSEEPHHPTKILAQYLSAVGEPKPTINHEAHHIICGKGRFRQVLIAQARLTMHLHGIGINDPINGVWLCNMEKNKEDDWATRNSVPHRKIHRYNYETWIGSSFRGRQNKLQFVTRLRNVKFRIKSGTMPVNVMKKKDVQWDGREE